MFLVVLLALVVVNAPTMVYSGGPPDDGNVKNPPLTHLGQSPQDHVLLKAMAPGFEGCDSFLGQTGLLRIFPDGFEETSAFEVPTGKMLVVTDVDWQVSKDPTAFLTTRILIVRLGLETVDFYRTSTTVTPDIVTGGLAGGNDRSVSGVVFGPGTSPCIAATTSDNSGGAVHTLTSTFVRGYLIDR
jgi:hypothetical protein